MNNLNSKKLTGITQAASITCVVTAQTARSNSGTVSVRRNIAATATSLTSLPLGDVTTALENVANMRATNGSELSRLGFASELLTINKANLEAATSRITDVDVAEESTQLARWNTMVSAGTSMLTQANQSAQTALKLLQ